jgi:hypothetical protein
MYASDPLGSLGRERQSFLSGLAPAEDCLAGLGSRPSAPKPGTDGCRLAAAVVVSWVERLQLHPAGHSYLAVLFPIFQASH